jgi:amino acid adenylation domain-containing protein/non-ribosomal peptide synthase protein (TIGR01720 family)
MNQSEQNYKQTLKKASDHIKTLLSEIDTLKKNEPIAIIGMACRFPGDANTPENFWNLIENRIDAIREVPPNRWDANAYYDPDPEAPGKMYTKMGGFLDGIENFDARFFGISPKELRSLDPQQRLLLETSWQAFENAGINTSTLKGSNTGVFIGILNTDYARSHLFSMDFNRIDAYSVTGMSFSTASGRISYYYGLEGPNISIDTACSSSLVSVHLACQSLKNQECNMAVAGGVNLILTPEVHIGFCKMKALSPDGRCKSFDASADGLSRGEGCGIIVLKRLSDAKNNGDPILAIIKGSSVNQDGKSNGFTAPNGLAQRKVIDNALNQAGIKSDAVSYIEAHGTGTPLGDPIEMNAIGHMYGKNRNSDNPLFVGSVKANIGHLESAAGVASIIKTVLAINNQKIPPQLHFRVPNPEIAWNDISVKIPMQLRPWKEKIKIAGVSAFGFGGTNAHIIIEQAPNLKTHDSNTSGQIETKEQLHILPLSARTDSALDILISNYSHYIQSIETDSGIRVGDICLTASEGRNHFYHRTYVIGSSIQELSKQLISDNLSKSSQRPNPKIVFMFTGQGSQYPKMGWDLYETQPVFKDTLNQCSELLEPYLKASLIDLLYHSDDSDNRIHEAFYTQPAVFSIEYALGKVWESWGIRPSVVMGHSIGEYAAACIAGVFSLKDGLKLVAERGRLISSLPENGAMATVIADKNKVINIINNYKDRVSLAAVNAPENILISGQRTAIEEMIEIFNNENIPVRLMQISHAIHSLLMEPIQDTFYDVASKIQFSKPIIPIISNVSGQHAGEEICTPDYWVRHVRQEVRFFESMLTIDKQGYEIFLEIGTTSTLSSLGMQCIPRNKGLWLQSLGVNNAMFNMRPGRSRDYNDWKPMLQSLGQLYIHGIDIDWSAFGNQFEQYQKIVLPNYPFQRDKYWVPPVYKQDDVLDIKESVQDIVPKLKADETIECKISDENQMKSNVRHGEKILSKLLSLIHQVSEIDLSENEYDTSLLSLGFDSLMISRLQSAILQTFDVDINIRNFFTHTQTINELSDYIEDQMHSEAHEEDQKSTKLHKKIDAIPLKTNDLESETEKISSYEKIVSQQLNLMAKQLEFLNAHKVKTTSGRLEPCAKLSQDFQEMDNETLEKKQGNFRSMKIEPDHFTPRQKLFIQEVIQRYNQNHQKSKQYAEKYRPVLCDWINSLNFRMSLKEIIYPVVHDRSEAARIWDIDGNEYIDMAMGYGVSFLGNKPLFITQAISKQMEKGFELGPQDDSAGEVASLIAELTGVERVTFCNTGSEAVMVALRIARKVTGKRKIVLFSGSYHGTSDAVMADTDEKGLTYPTAPGNPPAMVKDVIVLDYGTDASLNAIQKLAESHKLAAVLVEPVQSRRPGFQPREFLTHLRQITQQTQTALIFDEVLTGFRIHPGGCQAWFNIQADIVTYGKIVSGGMPIGIVAGKARFLDALDGGMWQFGDHSYPLVKPTVFAGTFCKHPLVMAAAKAALLHMKENGAELQEKVNIKTAYFANTLNDFFKNENIAIKIEYFGSVFRFESFGKYSLALLPIEMELLFYLLLEKGVYTWERRICFFSTAHTDEDIELMITLVKESLWEMRAGGFLLEALKDQPIPPVKHSRHYPMSKAQQRLFVLSEIDGDQDAYQIAQAAIFEGKLDVQKFEDCFIEIVKRHEILRTSFDLKDGKLIQIIHDHVDFQVDYREGAEDDINNMIKKFCKPLDLSNAPVFKVVLIKLSVNRYLMLAITHHMIIDGLSWNIIVKDFCCLYEGKSLAPLNSQYIDYVFWEQTQLETEKMKQDDVYWKKKFSEEIPLLNLPTDFQRPAQRSSKGGIHFFSLSNEKMKQLKTLARNSSSTITMIFLAAYTIFLHKLTGQENIIVGIPVDSRPPDGFGHVVGMFVNTLPSQNFPTRELSFNEYINHVKQNALKDYEHRDFPFDLIVKNLDPEKDMSRNALIETLLVYESADERLFELKDLSFIPYNYKNDAAAFDLVLEIIEQNNEARLNFEYCSGLFKHETIIRWSENFLNLVNEIIAHPNQPISELSIISTKEQQQILFEFNNTAVDYPMDKTLIDLFESQVMSSPELTAVVFQDSQLTYSHLNKQANKVAHFLKEKYHIMPDDRVGLLLNPSLNMIIGILGIMKAGGAYVPVDTAYPLDRISYIFQDSHCKLVLTENILNQTAGLTFIDINTIQHSDDQNPSRNADPDNAAYVIYTSGSTGTPKGVIIAHQSIINTIIWRSRYYSFGTNDRILQLPSYAFDSSVEDIFTPLISGSSLVLIPQEKKLDLEYIGNLVAYKNITHFLATPAFYKTFLNNISEKLQNLRFVTVAGENIGSDLVSLHFENLKNVKLYNEYGPTENSVCATVFEFLPDNHHILIGKPISNNFIYILDPDKHLCPIGIIGEICISGKGLARGYLNRSELTEEKFIKNPFLPNEKMYCTGDLGRWLPDGNIEFLGRMDDQVKIRGFRVELGEIEKQIREYPSVKETVIVARKNSEDITELTAYIMTREQLEITLLRRHLTSVLPDYMIPSFFVRLNELPLTPNGKIDKKALPLPDKDDVTTNADFMKPRNTIEEKLVSAWKKALGRKKIGINDNYFDLGGDSIKAIQVAAFLNLENLKLQVRDIFQYPVISELAEHVTEVIHYVDQSTITGIVPLTAIQVWFFKTQLNRQWINHFNQAVVIHARKGLHEDAIRIALKKIQTHHDVLRMKYKITHHQIIQTNCDLEYPLSLNMVDLRNVDNPDYEYTKHAEKTQTSIDLEKGPLLKAVLFKLKGEDRLLLVIHHLVIDAISWQILVDDLISCYEQILSGKTITLPEKTNSFKLWSEKIHAYANSEKLRKEKSYWESLSNIALQTLPKDYDTKDNLYKDLKTESFKLSQEYTNRLLKEVNHAYRTDIQDILITALAKGIKNLNGMEKIPLMLESHGRVDLLGDINITRTAGWFTSEYPVLLELPDSNDIGKQIKFIKETLRKVPDKGIGYGILKYLTTEGKRSLNMNPEIIFNYLGQLNWNMHNDQYEILEVPDKNCVSPELKRCYVLEIEGMVIRDRFQLIISYNKKHYKSETIEKLLLNFEKGLLELINHCQAHQSTELTPADLTYKGLELDDLDDIFS